MASTVTIISSVIDFQLPQIDGTYVIREIHTDSLDATYIVDYNLPSDGNAQTHLSNDATILLASLPGQEISNNISQVELLGSLANPTFNYSTSAQNLTALRAAYLQSTNTQAIMIGDFLNTLTTAQLESIFSMTSGQVATLKTNYLTPASIAAASIRNTQGT
jgi:hypothetical protein